MPISRQISQVTIGGSAGDNPVPFSDANFAFNANQLLLTYRNINVIVFHNNQQATLEVTGKVLVDSGGSPMVGDNDIVYLPCPPFCEDGD